MAEEARAVGAAPAEPEEEKKKMKVLVAVDESEGSFYALRWALDHLCGDAVVGAEPATDHPHVLLLHVEQPFQYYMYPAGPGVTAAVYTTSSTVESIRKGQEENTRRLLSQAGKICLEKRVTAEILVVDGDPKDMICQVGEQMGSDLVVVGSRGLSKIKSLNAGEHVRTYGGRQVNNITRLWRRSMAEEARIVGVATGEARERKKMKVLVAVDESEGSFYALRWALDHLCGDTAVGAAEPTTDHPHVVLLLLHVEQPFQHYMFPAGPAVYATSAAVESIRKGQEENTRRLLSRAMKICLEKKVTAETLVMGGDSKDMICEAGEQMGTDLVVVGSRGLSTIKRAFLGSVSDYVAHHAPCPVLIVKPQKKHTQEQAAPPHA